MQKALLLPVPPSAYPSASSSSSSSMAPKSTSASENTAFGGGAGDLVVKVHKALSKSFPRHLFYIHQNKIESLILFLLSPSSLSSLGGEAVPVESRFLANYRDEDGRDLSIAEDSMYGVRVVPNHARDFPHVTEMAVPSFLGTHPSKGEGSKEIGMGNLVAAFEIALTSAVIIDAWQASIGEESIVWATTTIEGQSFCVLERMYVVSEVSWGLQSIVQVDLCGRNAATGAVIVEHVSANEEEETGGEDEE